MPRAAPVRRDAALGADLTPLELCRAEQHARRARRGDGKSVWKPYPGWMRRKVRVAPYLRSVTDNVLTIEELRRRGGSLTSRGGTGLIGLPFSVQLPGERPAQTVVSIFWSASSPVPLFLITVPWSKPYGRSG
jgi:hypothetical protein